MAYSVQTDDCLPTLQFVIPLVSIDILAQCNVMFYNIRFKTGIFLLIYFLTSYC